MNLPFMLTPAAKDYLWGGSRLNDDFNKHIDMDSLAETWECSTHPDGQSLVADTGEKLGDVLAAHPEYLGSHSLALTEGKPELPILIKLIDAKADLSVQVHPDDEYAKRVENSLGKTEMWYVLEATEGANLVYGFDRDMTEEKVRSSLENGTFNKYLNHVPVRRNDLFFIAAGTVHAIGAGALIAEIQENSNITYRLYDYDRVDKNGNKRELHIDKGLEVANLKASVTPRQPMHLLKYSKGCAREHLARCRYFQTERLLLNTEGRVLPEFRAETNSFHALLITEGCGVLFGEGINLNFFKGDCIFVPADSIPFRLHGRAKILNTSC